MTNKGSTLIRVGEFALRITPQKNGGVRINAENGTALVVERNMDNSVVIKPRGDSHAINN